MEEEVNEAQCAHPSPSDDYDLISSNQCLCLPKAEFNTKKLNQTAAVLSFC